MEDRVYASRPRCPLVFGRLHIYLFQFFVPSL
jgi:hypothetical protein